MRWTSHGILLLLLLLLLRIIHVLRLLSRTGLLLVGVHVKVMGLGLGRRAIGIEGRWRVSWAKAVRGLRIHDYGSMALCL